MKDKEKIRIEINKDLRKNKKENTCCWKSSIFIKELIIANSNN